MTKVSVIVPVYKVEEYLTRCVESILSQTYPDFELILVDDGSPDRCGAICDEYAAKDSRIVVIHKENGGVSVARNAALDIARGEYIAFCDGDDFWEHELLEISLGVIEKETADCVLFGYNLVDDSGFLRSRVFTAGCYELDSEQNTVDYLIQTQFGGKHGWELWDHIFRRDIIETYHIRCCTTCNNFAEDMGFVCRYMLHAKRLICIPECLYNYYIREDSMMRKSADKIRLNDVNEVSFDVGMDFYMTIYQPAVRKQFPILHYLIVNNQLQKLYKIQTYERIPVEIASLSRHKWWKHNLTKLYCCYESLKKYYGDDMAQRLLLFATYLLHGNWKLYSYESGLYYKWFSKQKR